MTQGGQDIGKALHKTRQCIFDVLAAMHYYLRLSFRFENSSQNVDTIEELMG